MNPNYSRKPTNFPFSQETWNKHQNANSLADLNSNIQSWLLSQDLTCCIIQLKGKPYKLHALSGLSEPPEDSSDLPQLDCPFSSQLEEINHLS